MDKNETEQQILAEINKSASFFQRHKKLCFTGLILIVFFTLALISYHMGQKSASESIPGVTTTYSPQNTPLAPSVVLDAANANGKTISNNDANDIARLANRSVYTEKAYAHSITTDEAVADNKAGEIAKNSKASMVIKQTSTDAKASNDKMTVQDNNYYIVQQERKHDIKAGCAYVDSEAYVTASYRNRQVEYTAMYNPSTGKTGAMVQVTVARW